MNGCYLAWRYTRTLMHRGFGLSAELYVKRLNRRSSQWLWPVATAVVAATTGTTTLNPPASKKNGPSSKIPPLFRLPLLSPLLRLLCGAPTISFSRHVRWHCIKHLPLTNPDRQVPCSAAIALCTVTTTLYSSFQHDFSLHRTSNIRTSSLFPRSEAKALPVFGLLQLWNCRRGDMTFWQLHSLRWPQLLARCQFWSHEMLVWWTNSRLCWLLELTSPGHLLPSCCGREIMVSDPLSSTLPTLIVCAIVEIL